MVFRVPTAHVATAWSAALGLAIQTAALDMALLQTSSITMRYYGNQPISAAGFFHEVQSLRDICDTMMAVCQQVHVGHCVRTPEEMAVPYQAVFAEGIRTFPSVDVGHLWTFPFRDGQPGAGYMLLNGTEGTQLLWSHCSEGCEDCAQGTGRVLAVEPSSEDATSGCRQTPGMGVFLIMKGQTNQQCVTSMRLFYADLAAREARYKTVVPATVAILIFLGFSCCFFTIAARPKPKPPKSKPKFVSKGEIEQRFPVKTVDDMQVCIICLASMETDDVCRMLQCAHTFHAECIVEWWTHVPRVSIECPTCRMKQSLQDEANGGEPGCTEEADVEEARSAINIIAVAPDAPHTPAARDDAASALVPTMIGSFSDPLHVSEFEQEFETYRVVCT